MADQGEGGIAWTEQTWNPIRGCTRVSEGCRYCYAEVVAARFSDPGMAYEGLAKRTAAGPRWTGKVKLIEEHLKDPLRWKRPRRIFVNSMSDLFHEALSDADVLRVFDVMREAHDRGHTFQVLTKRAERMRQFCSQLDFDSSSGEMSLKDRGLNRQGEPISFTPVMKDLWLGVSVEDQKAADARVPDLVATPAAVRWLSVEPQLGLVLLRDEWLARLHWVVIGGESGAQARPFNVAWARQLIAQCRAAGVAVFMKQLGSAAHVVNGGALGEYTGKGGDPGEWPEDIRVREYPR